MNRLWLENDFKKVAQLVTVITMFQKIHGALATQNNTMKESGNSNEDGSEVLYMFGAILMILARNGTHMRWNRPREDLTMRSMRVTADGTAPSTRPTTRSVGERGGGSDTMQGHQNHGNHRDGSASRSSLIVFYERE